MTMEDFARSAMNDEILALVRAYLRSNPPIAELTAMLVEMQAKLR